MNLSSSSQKCCWRFALLQCVAYQLINFLSLNLVIGCIYRVWCLLVLTYNGLRLCEEADFGALNCQHTTKVDARQNVQLTTEPAFLQNRCYQQCFLVCRFLWPFYCCLGALAWWLFWIFLRWVVRRKKYKCAAKCQARISSIMASKSSSIFPLQSVYGIESS